MSDKQQFDDDDDIAVKEQPPKLKQPPMFKVILLNDDYTPMEFVVHVLESFFKKPFIIFQANPGHYGNASA